MRKHARVSLIQRLTAVDSNLVKISVLKLFGETEGDNNRRKAKAWLPREYLNKARDLKTGKFLHKYGSEITSEKVLLFRSRVKPKPYAELQKQRNLFSQKYNWSNSSRLIL